MLRAVIDLAATYDRLSRPADPDVVSAHHRTASERGRHARTPLCDEPDRPISLLAAAVPAAANLDVAVHALHVLPPTTTDADRQLSARIRQDAATAIHLCERALELDGTAHGYRAAEWHPIVYDIATEITTSAKLDREPPSIVSCAQDCVGWLAQAIAELDHDAPDATRAISEALGRLLALSLFAQATQPTGSGGNAS